MVNERTLIKDVAGLLTASDHFARDGERALFRYLDGVYVPGGGFIRQRVKQVLLEAQLTERWSRNLAHEVIEFILLDAPELDVRPSTTLVNVQNGLLDIWNGELLPHSARFLSRIRIPVRYDPLAECPRIEAFIEQTFPPDAPPKGCGRVRYTHDPKSPDHQRLYFANRFDASGIARENFLSVYRGA